MKPPGAVAPVVVAAVFALAAAAPAWAASSIEGTVREAGTRRPIPGALVSVAGTDVATYTDDLGAFVLAFEDNSRVSSATIDVDTPGYEHLLQIVKLRTDRATTSIDLYLVPKELGETRVRERRSRDNVARGAHHIEDNEVNELPGTYGDPAKAIENFPGMGRVLLSQGSLFIRGASPGESAVFVDDYEIPDLYHFTGSTSVINIPFVESVELVPGAFSSRYGRSTGGIVTLKTRKLPTDDVHGFAKLDVIDGGAYVGVPLGPKIAVGASARRSFLDAIRNTQKALQGTGDDVVLTPTYWDYQLKLDWDTAPGHEMVVFAFGSGDREEYEADGRGALDPFFETNDSDFHRVSLRYSHNLGSGLTHTFTPVVGYARQSRLEQGGVRLRNGETFDAQLRDEVTWRSGNTRIIVGLDATARHDAFVYGGLLAPNDVRELEAIDLEAIVAADRVTQQTWRITGGAYVEGILEPLDNVVLTPGFRFEAYQLEDVPHVSLEPRFAGSWEIVPGDWSTLLRVAAGRFSRPPDPDEIAAARAENFDLEPQEALHFQGGVEQAVGDRLAVSANFFNIWRNNLSTRSTSFPVPERFGTRSVYDGGSGHSVGAEALVRVGVPNRYFAWLTYSLARHERLDGASYIALPYVYPSPFDTTHLLGVVGQMHLPAGFRVGARYRVATGMPDDRVAGGILDADTGRFVAVPGPKGDRRFPVFQALDVRVDWATRLDWFELDLYADLVNVNTLFGRPVEGTLYNFDFTQTKDRLGLPLIPAIGAKATF
jgi:hypothetical protein